MFPFIGIWDGWIHTYVVVDSVKDGAASKLGSAAAKVVHVVVLEGDLVTTTSEVQVPVVVAVAGSRVCGFTVDVGVGDADTARGVLAQDDVLTADLVGGHMVDPDQVRAGQSDGVTTPDVLGVQFRDADVLDDDVLDAVGHAKTLALDHARGAIAEDGLVRSHLDGGETSVVVGDAHGGSIGLVVVTPAVLVDSDLAGIVGAPRSTSSLGGGALSFGEVKGLLENNDTGGGVLEV